MTQAKKPTKRPAKTTRKRTPVPPPKPAPQPPPSKPRYKAKPTAKPTPKKANPGTTSPRARAKVATVHPAFEDDATAGQQEQRWQALAEKELTDEVLAGFGKLNDREMAFIRAYLRLRKAIPAAREAGFTESYAQCHAGSLLRRPAIKAAVAHIDRLAMQALAITDQAILERLWEEANYAFESSSRVNALKALAELRDMFPAKRLKHSVDAGMQALADAIDQIDGDGTGLGPTGAAHVGPTAH